MISFNLTETGFTGYLCFLDLKQYTENNTITH